MYISFPIAPMEIVHDFFLISLGNSTSFSITLQFQHTCFLNTPGNFNQEAVLTFSEIAHNCILSSFIEKKLTLNYQDKPPC